MGNFHWYVSYLEGRKPLFCLFFSVSWPWFNLGCFNFKADRPWMEWRHSPAKGRFVQGLYKPIHGYCAIYFYTGVTILGGFQLFFLWNTYISLYIYIYHHYFWEDVQVGEYFFRFETTKGVAYGCYSGDHCKKTLFQVADLLQFTQNIGFDPVWLDIFDGSLFGWWVGTRSP